MDTSKLLKAIFQELLEEMQINKELKNRITRLVDKHSDSPKKRLKRASRRQPGPFDPMEVYRQQPETLQDRLKTLDVEQLKDIIAEHGMDRNKLAMKWRTGERLINLIISTVESRSKKGDAFRGVPNSEE